MCVWSFPTHEIHTPYGVGKGPCVWIASTRRRGKGTGGDGTERLTSICKTNEDNGNILAVCYRNLLSEKLSNVYTNRCNMLNFLDAHSQYLKNKF